MMISCYKANGGSEPTAFSVATALTAEHKQNIRQLDCNHTFACNITAFVHPLYRIITCG
jgi:hypothetical protein